MSPSTSPDGITYSRPRIVQLSGEPFTYASVGALLHAGKIMVKWMKFHLLPWPCRTCPAQPLMRCSHNMPCALAPNTCPCHALCAAG